MAQEFGEVILPVLKRKKLPPLSQLHENYRNNDKTIPDIKITETTSPPDLTPRAPRYNGSDEDDNFPALHTVLDAPSKVTFAEGDYNDSEDSTEEREFEYPLCDCLCCEVYWTTFVAKIVENLFGFKLKHRSKKGTRAFKHREPVAKSKIGRRLKKAGKHARRKSVAVKRRLSKEWRDRVPTFGFQDPQIREMEAELARLRKLVDQGPGSPRDPGPVADYSDYNHNIGGDRRATHMGSGLGLNSPGMSGYTRQRGAASFSYNPSNSHSQPRPLPPSQTPGQIRTPTTGRSPWGSPLGSPRMGSPLSSPPWSPEFSHTTVSPQRSEDNNRFTNY